MIHRNLEDKLRSSSIKKHCDLAQFILNRFVSLCSVHLKDEGVCVLYEQFNGPGLQVGGEKEERSDSFAHQSLEIALDCFSPQSLSVSLHGVIMCQQIPQCVHLPERTHLFFLYGSKRYPCTCIYVGM